MQLVGHRSGGLRQALSNLPPREPSEERNRSAAVNEIEKPQTNHERFAATFAPFRGKEFRAREIKNMLDGIVAPGSRLPSDHAYGNKGASWCAGTDQRVFDRIGYDLYRVR